MIRYWVWLSMVLDAGSSHLKPLLDKYKTPLAIYKLPILELQNSFIVSGNELKRFCNKNLDKVDKIIAECEESKIDIVCYDDSRYPQQLKSIVDPPACLYVKGKLKDFNKLPIICLVGTRKISDYGKMVAWSLAARLATGGMVILSGGALGGDSEVHEGALAVGGKTIAVLPCGINYNYLKTNDFLRKNICDNGCVISELPPDTPLYKNAFQIRNRLLSGLSLGVAVIESPAISGTLITSKYAVEQGRDVFVVTGRPDDENYAGSNGLLRDGAKPIFDANDIFEEYIHLYPNVIDPQKAKNSKLSVIYRMLHAPKMNNDYPKKVDDKSDKTAPDKKIKKNIDETLPNSVKIVYNYINNDLFTIDELLGCGLSFEEVLSAVTQLELLGYIKAIPGGRYSMIN